MGNFYHVTFYVVKVLSGASKATTLNQIIVWNKYILIS
jgi:hypothetical protein